MLNQDNFRFVMPAQLEKANDGKWKIRGLASAEVVDRQGEILVQKGMDLRNIDAKKGFLNWNHDNAPESTIGLLTGYKQEGKKTYIEGELFQKHKKAQAVYSIMEALKEHGSGAMGLSVEGQILKRNDKNPKIIEKCVIRNVALTLSPVFDGSYAELAKSFGAASEIEFDTTKATVTPDGVQTIPNAPEAPVFTASQVVSLFEKALSTGPGALGPPNTLTGGDALKVEGSQEEDDETKEKKPKKVDGHTVDNGTTEAGMAKTLKSMNYSLYKSHIFTVLNRLQELYPEYSRAEIWEAVRTRLETKFPQIG